MESLPAEIAHGIVMHLNPNDLPLLASVSATLRRNLSPEALTVKFAKVHLELSARRAAGKRDGPFKSSWLHDIGNEIYNHPLLFNYGLAAVALHGFSFSEDAHLARLIFGCEWMEKLSDPAAISKRDRPIRLLAAAFRMGMWNLDSLPTASADSRAWTLPVVDAFIVALLAQSTDIVNAIAEKYAAMLVRDYEALKRAFLAAAAYSSMDMINTILNVLQLGDSTLDPFDETKHTPLLEACIIHDFRDPLALLPDHHVAFNAIIPDGIIPVLAFAAHMGYIDLVDFLLRKGAAMNPEVLCAAAGGCDGKASEETCTVVPMVRHFLALGADVNAANYQGFTPLLEAARHGCFHVLPLLLEAGADPNAAYYGMTALWCVISSKRVDIFEMLLDAGASIDARLDRSGKTLVHEATSHLKATKPSASTTMIITEHTVDIPLPPSSLSSKALYPAGPPPNPVLRLHVFQPAVIKDRPRARFPGVAVFTEIYQVTGPVERFCRQLAGNGYVVACPESFHDFEKAGVVIPYDVEGTDRGNRYKIEKTVASYDLDATLTLDYLSSHTNVKRGPLGATGMCLGGHLAFRCAFDKRVGAAVCFFATDIHASSLGLGKKDDSLDRCGDIKGECVMIFGKHDPHIPVHGRQLIYQTLVSRGVDFGWVELPASHAFLRDELSKGRYDPPISRLACDVMAEVFHRRLVVDYGDEGVAKKGEEEMVC
ncbi:hypothetical protein HDU96_010915 [Phlyctochytrium bullatum]|nr:hypothetical protein HDU96_010915 [Phlyctochytrium bullatum]